MTARALALGACLLLVGAGAAQAQDDEEVEYYYDKETSGYVELYGSGGYIMAPNSSGGDKGTGGVGAIVGGHLTPHFAMEANYEYQSDSNTSIATYNFKYVILTDRVQPYLKAGLGLLGGRPDHPFLFTGRFDAGITFFLTEQVALRGGASYVVATDDVRAALGNIGLVYYFY